MTTELIPVSPESYPVLASGQNVGQIIKQNLGGEQVTPADLTRIKVPAGGGTTWEVPGEDGEPQPIKVLEGILVHTARRRAYWPNTNPSGEPPACVSTDCVNGHGTPGGPCDACPFNQFGSQVKQDGGAGRGKACKESRLFFLLRAGQKLPDVVVVPPGSLRATKQYLLKLSVPYWGVLTRLTLDRVQNKDSIAYAQIHPRNAAMLEPEMARGIMLYAQELKSVFEQTSIEPGEVDGSE